MVYNIAMPSFMGDAIVSKKKKTFEVEFSREKNN